MGEGFDPDYFEPNVLRFEDPDKRLKLAFGKHKLSSFELCFLKARGGQCTGCPSLQTCSSHQRRMGGFHLKVDANEENRRSEVYDIL